MRRLERLHALSERLRRASPAAVSSRELAAEFEVSRRTIERDLDALRRAGATLWGQPGRSGGVGILDGPRRLVSLSDAEIAGLVIAAHAARDAPFATDARRAVESLIACAGPETQVSIESIREQVLLADEVEPSGVEPRTRHVLEEAVVQRRQVSLRYRDQRDQVTKRLVDPVGFLSGGSSWSLVAFCRLREQGRLFRLERIERVTITTKQADEHDLRATLGDVPFDTRKPR